MNRDLRKFIDLGAWDLKTTFGPIGYGRHPDVGPELWLQFSQSSPYFLKNHEESPVKLSNLKKFIELGPGA